MTTTNKLSSTSLPKTQISNQNPFRKTTVRKFQNHCNQANNKKNNEMILRMAEMIYVIIAKRMGRLKSVN